METRGTALWRALVCGLAFVVSTGWQQTAAPLDPTTPLTLDVASCAGLDPRAADGPRMEGPTFPTPDPDALLVQLETLERQLADAADADVPELLFALGRLKTTFYVGDDSPHASYAASRPEEFRNSWWLWVYRGTDFQELIRRYPGSERADDAAYALSLVPRPHHCEGDLACRLNVAWEPIAAFLQAYPDSPFAAAAVDRALAAFGEVETELDLRSTAYWFHRPGSSAGTRPRRVELATVECRRARLRRRPVACRVRTGGRGRTPPSRCAHLDRHGDGAQRRVLVPGGGRVA